MHWDCRRGEEKKVLQCTRQSSPLLFLLSYGKPCRTLPVTDIIHLAVFFSFFFFHFRSPDFQKLQVLFLIFPTSHNQVSLHQRTRQLGSNNKITWVWIMTEKGTDSERLFQNSFPEEELAVVGMRVEKCGGRLGMS